jgi:hypothetical protein
MAQDSIGADADLGHTLLRIFGCDSSNNHLLEERKS